MFIKLKPKNFFIKNVCLTLILALLVTAVPLPSLLNTAEATGYSPFHDVSPNHWSLAHIVKSEIRGIVLGDGKGLFDPENTVTQLQAVTMAVRAMGLENLTHNTNNHVDTSEFDLPTTWNAKGYVSVAITKGLIDIDNFRFVPNAGASRAWIAQLLIRMIGAEDELVKSATTTFIDDDYIPIWAKASVALAADKNLITGVKNPSGGFNFLPNNAVKRAELAALISRADRYMPDVHGQLPLAYIVDIDETSILLANIIQGTQNSEPYSFDLTSTSMIFDMNFQQINKDNLQVGDLIRYAFNNDLEFVYGEVLNKEHYGDYSEYAPIISVDLSGTFVQYYINDRLLTIRDAENRLHMKHYAENIVIKQAGQTQSIPLDNIKLGTPMDLVIQDGIIVEILLTAEIPLEQPNTTGTVFNIDLNNRILTLEQNEEYVSYDFSQTILVEYGSLQFPTVRDLQIGDIVEIHIENGIIVAVTLINSKDDNQIQGTIVALNASEHIITIRSTEQKLQAFEVTEDTNYILHGATSPTFAHLQNGDQITFTADEQVILTIEVTNRVYEDYAKGTVVSVDISQRLITITDENSQYKTYKIDADVTLLLGNITYPVLSNIVIGSTVYLLLDLNVVVEVFMILEN